MLTGCRGDDEVSTAERLVNTPILISYPMLHIHAMLSMCFSLTMTTFACILFTVGAFKEVRERAGEKRATYTIRRGDMLETTTRQELHTHMQDIRATFTKAPPQPPQPLAREDETERKTRQLHL